MERREKSRKLFAFLMSLISWGLMTAIWGVIWYRYHSDIIRPFGYKGNWLVIAVYGILLFIFNRIYGGYGVGYYKRSDVAFSGILASFITNFITYFQTSLISRAMINPIPILIMMVADIIIIIIWSSLTTKLYYRLNPPRKIILIYGSKPSAVQLMQKMTMRSEKYSISETVSIEEGLDKIFDRILNYKSVIICDVKSEDRNKILKFCFENSIRTYITPKISDILVRGADNIHLFDTPLLLCKNMGLSTEQRFIKRLMDIIISGLGIIITSPIMLITALAIKLYDRGPVFFKQRRMTQNYKEFDILKFRSMIVDAEKDGKSHPCENDDPRITTVGKLIRKTRIDELPQLFNIFIGDMSIVGPRPERVEHIEKYSKEIPEFVFRMKVKGGLTGYAQVVGKYNTSAYDKLKLDLMYISHYSIWEDLKIIFMTIKVIFQKESTEGFDNNEKTEK